MSEVLLHPSTNTNTIIDIQKINLPSSTKSIDDSCRALFEALFPRPGDPIWKSSVILKLKVSKSSKFLVLKK